MSTVGINTAEWLEDFEIRSEYGSETLKYDIATALVTARKIKNLTQAALANIAGVSQAYIAKLESGEANPTIGRIGAILASIWLKPQTSLVPLIALEGRDNTSSASPSLSVRRSGSGWPLTANDIPYVGIPYPSASGEGNISANSGQFDQRAVLSAAF